MPSVTSVTLAEGNSGITNFIFTFTRDSQATSQNFTYSIGGGTATAGTDFSGSSGSFTLTAGGGLTQTITVPVFGDLTLEPNETFNVEVFEVGNAVALATGLGTINNDDAAPSLSINDVTLAEGNGGGTTNFTFTVTRTGDLAGTSSVNYTVGLGTAQAADFAGGALPAGGTVTFAANESSKTITIPVLADTVVDALATEVFTVTLSGEVGATVADAVGDGSIIDDDSSFAIAVLAAPADEGTSATAGAATNYDFRITRTGATAGAATINYAVTPGAASPTDAADFVTVAQIAGQGVNATSALGGTVTFVAGQTTADIRLGVSPDFNIELAENFIVTISGQSTGTITTAAANGTINNDDVAGSVSIDPGSVAILEGDSGSQNAVITLVRTGGNGAPFAVTITSAPGTATAGTDFTAISQVVNFAAQQTSAQVLVPILGDLLIEPVENFTLTLSAPTNGATLGTTTGTVSIADNDSVGTITVGSVDVSEAAGSATVTVTRSGGGAAFTVQYGTSDGSALVNSDYSAATGTLSFAAGQNIGTFTVSIVNDAVVEPDESFSVNLSNLSGGGTLLTSTGTVRIINDDGVTTPGGPVNSGSTTFVTSNYVQPANNTQTTISTQNNAGTERIDITGNATSTAIIGNYGVNVLTGGGGADTLIGLLGNDIYIVSTSNTIVAENANEGNDTVSTFVDFVLSPTASVELLQTGDSTAATAINLTGSVESQQIIGNAGDNIINGFGGADTMIGLGGNDTYLVRGPGDQVIEANGGGNDTVFTTVSYSLGVNEVERLSTVVQADTTNIDLIGNFATQAVIGNYGNNVLNGGSGGIDTLIGLRGDDVYAVGDSRTDVFENAGEGNDTVVTSVDYALDPGVSVEVLAVQNRAGTATLNLFGNELAQTIAGNEGTNYIDGGAGNDVLIGGGGVDTFAFTTALGPNNVDVVADFAVGVDRIGLFNAVFNLGAGGPTNAIFVNGTAAGDADDRLIYNVANGQLFYDADGNGAGAQVLFAIFAAGTQLSAASFDVLIPAPTVA